MIYFFSSLPFLAFSQDKPTIKSLPDTAIFIPQKLTLLFVGDLMQHQDQINAAYLPDGRYDYSECFKYVKEEISKADIAIANLEVTLAGAPYKGYPLFSAPDEYLFAIKEAGFDVLLTANNHCLDRGRKGLERTVLMLDSLQIPYAGTYINKEARAEKYPLLMEQNGFRIALLNYTYGTNGIPITAPNVVNLIDKEIMEYDIETARTLQPDAVIVCIHWGYEYKLLPNQTQKELADWLLSKGVTHIIGAHPHVVQPMELRTDSVYGTRHLVVYSLGNFISNMQAPNTEGGAIVKLELTKDSDDITRVSDCGYSLVWTMRPAVSSVKNHTLIPVDYSRDAISSGTNTRINRFTETVRPLFEKHNVEVEEYFFEEK